MAENGREIPEQTKNTDCHPLHFSSFNYEQDVDKEVRLRNLKDRQNEERQKKLEEIKAQALAAQRFKEQKEQERRKRLDDMRVKDDQRRLQVEEKKKAINEAERDRLESIIQRNQERHARIETKKRHERSNMVFAFGSSTPRMLDPTDMSVSYWGQRRATSTQNITSASTGNSLTRRQSERDLDVGSKKRATSAGGLERAGESLTSPTTPAGCASGYLGRRRTDLVPTIPSRDSSFHSSTSRKSLNHSPASSRPSSSLSQQSTNSISSSIHVKHRISNTPRRPRPASIAVTGVTHDKLNVDRGENKPPLPKTRKSLSKTNTSEKIEKPKSKLAKSPAEETAPKVVSEDKKDIKDVKKQEECVKKPDENEARVPEPVQSKEPTPPPHVAEIKKAPVPQVEEEQVPKPLKLIQVQKQPSKEDNIIQHFINTERKAADESANTQISEAVLHSSVVASAVETTEVKVLREETKEVKEEGKQENGDAASNEMTTSMSKPRITTEEEAKAALAERRRLIREETEKQAELERQKIEAEQKAEFERQQKEEEQARLLAEMQRQAEQERLQEAIKETQKRDEEERLRKEEEFRQKLLKEEADQKAREEAERQKAELQKKLENEEKEREERRKRVEMIMSRTRGKNNANNLASQQNSQDKNENSSDDKEQVENKLNEENTVNENKLNGTKQENGTTENTTKNGKDVGIVDNIIPDESVKNANTVTDTINTDSINSNSSWQPTQQYGNLVCNNNNS